MTTDCSPALTYERFLDYWFGDLPSDQQELLEAHLFECEMCAKSAERWGNDTLALRERAHAEFPNSALTRSEVLALGRRAVVIDVPQTPHLEVQLSEPAVHVFHVKFAPELLRVLERLDVEYVKAEFPDPVFHVSGVPFEQRTGDVFLACHKHVLLLQGTATMRVLGTERGRTRTLFETEIRFV